MRFFKTNHLTYQTSKKLFILSVILVSASLIFSAIFFINLFLLSLYFVTVFLFAIASFFIKAYIYSRSLNASQSSVGSGAPFWPLLIALIVVMFIPFLVVLVLEPAGVLLLINGYIAGVNLPEIILYVYTHLKKD
ncbi:MAG: hypothetical protein JSV51_06955 [Candidatus Bathyarchaeota archaeon]|nr:MAG: hypothetical protein JSV51_06955 [Candidatus Bathyarchaeota archaeon]